MEITVSSSRELVICKVKFVSEWPWRYSIPQVMSANLNNHEGSLKCISSDWIIIYNNTILRSFARIIEAWKVLSHGLQTHNLEAV